MTVFISHVILWIQLRPLFFPFLQPPIRLSRHPAHRLLRCGSAHGCDRHPATAGVFCQRIPSQSASSCAATHSNANMKHSLAQTQSAEKGNFFSSISADSFLQPAFVKLRAAYGKRPVNGKSIFHSALPAPRREENDFYLLSHSYVVLCHRERRPGARSLTYCKGKMGKVHGRPAAARPPPRTDRVYAPSVHFRGNSLHSKFQPLQKKNYLLLRLSASARKNACLRQFPPRKSKLIEANRSQ